MKGFNSQICTTREQSERLLALGLKQETADMALYQRYAGDDDEGCMIFEEAISPKPSMWRNDIPAWSLHRLIEMADTAYLEEGRRDDDDELWFSMDRCYCWNNHESFYATNLYDSLINCIEWLIKGGCFNKEYLV